MGTIKITGEEIRLLNIFRLLTGVTPKDCVIEQSAVGFLIDKEDMGLAIGKNGQNIKKVKEKLLKDVFLIHDSPNIQNFIQNLFYPVQVKSVKVSEGADGKIVTVEVQRKDYKNVVGERGERIKIAKTMAHKNFKINDINIRVI